MGWRLYDANGIQKRTALIANGLTLDTDSTFAANSDAVAVSQKAIKTRFDGLSNLYFSLNGDNAVTGTGNFASGYLKLPVSSAALSTAFVEFDNTRKMVLIGDSERNRAIGPQSWAVYATHPLYVSQATYSKKWDLFAAVGIMYFPVVVPAHMMVDGFRVGVGDAAFALRTFNVLLYENRMNNGNSDLVLLAHGAYNTSVSGPVTVNVPLTPTRPLYIPPGSYICAIQNLNASGTQGILGHTTNAAYHTAYSINVPSGVMGTTDGTSTLDVSGSWASSENVPVFAIMGRFAGQASAWG